MPGVPIGEILREAREERNLTVDMVADELMIRRFYLDALENGHYHDLPERVYAIGFVKNYVKYLGLDDQGLLEQFKREAYGARNGSAYQVNLTMPEPVIHSIVPGRSAIISALVVLGVLVAGIVFFTRSEGDARKADTAIPAPSLTADAETLVDETAAGNPANGTADRTITTEAPEFTSAAATETPNAANGDSPAPNTGDAPAANGSAANGSAVNGNGAAANPALTQIKNQRAIEALQSAWVEVKDANGKTLYTGILKASQLLPLPDHVKLTLTTGNAGGLRMILNGQAQEPLGQLNEVKRNIVLDANLAASAAAPQAETVAPSAGQAAAPAASSAPQQQPPVTFER